MSCVNLKADKVSVVIIQKVIKVEVAFSYIVDRSTINICPNRNIPPLIQMNVKFATCKTFASMFFKLAKLPEALLYFSPKILKKIRFNFYLCLKFKSRLVMTQVWPKYYKFTSLANHETGLCFTVIRIKHSSR